MTLKNTLTPITLKSENSTFSFLASGDAFEWIHDSVMINDFHGTNAEGSSNNIYLRIYNDNTINSYPLIGVNSNCSIEKSNTALRFTGSVQSVNYTVTFRLTPYGIWYWDISLTGECQKADVIYSQDIGVASAGSVASNELYTAQYLGHSVFESDNGYVICSRQNMSQGGTNPYLQQGSLGIRANAYSTDGTQFFGLSYKKTNVPEALSSNLPSTNKQYELSHIALQTETFSINGNKAFSFYGICKADHPEAIKEIEYAQEINDAYSYNSLEEFVTSPIPASIIGAPFASPEWNMQQINEQFPNRHLEEIDNDTLYSFFTPSNGHVVLQSKELVSERPHGHILMTNFDMTKVPTGVVSSTNYMYGVFNCQFVVGNTTYNKLLSNHRGLLNVQKNSGQRIFVKIDNLYRQLTLPAAYEMEVSSSTWYYQLEDDVLVVSSFVTFDRPEVVLQIRSTAGKAYDFIVSNQITAGADEVGQIFELEQEDSTLIIKPSKDCYTRSYYPDLNFRIHIPEGSQVSDDRVFYDNHTMDSSIVTISIDQKSNFEIILQGSESNDTPAFEEAYDFNTHKAAYEAYYNELVSNFNLSTTNPNNNITTDKLNATIRWYSHDTLIHFASPHGLEQSGGAAWGTRDVCQGPVEFFLTTGHNSMVRDILLLLFDHQIEDVFEWPQWFMFDQYPLHQEDCHGDVVFWPLKAVSDYIHATGDTTILDEVVDYRNGLKGTPVGKPETILEHIKRAITTIRERFLPGTSLISYAGGDWDDTLQPANKQLKDNLVSAWTQALAQQTLTLLSDSVIAKDEAFSIELSQMATDIRDSFYRYLIKDGVIAGFLYREADGTSKVMLHPDDTETSINYRLIPLTRSIIAELADSRLAATNVSIIDKELACPDGIRLMNHPASYEGGISKIFLRAEQAANIGREISLQYVHAHIRYIEAMATLGEADKAWKALMQINPILLTECVPNALTRQSNVYFSSSEGCYNDRYEYAANFDKLKDGSIPVKGGWRLYSSGPGIYIRRVIADLLGIRFTKDSLIIDPVINTELDGLTFAYTCFGKTVTFVYHASNQTDSTCLKINDEVISSTQYNNVYRNGGIIIAKDVFLRATESNNELHLYL
ncbi:GH36-type glycosyl hydrolase domain-containing protein [Anaerosporobacter sp.]|uniref:GH36-type glycosyl hydrolase domain-containing protein n=1 Tax=Anaerosporobacter sp. TaxID=1872529 RepID=UPI00286EB535|nr:cellobiose phosphorylase [Anaerosporobacter sp.]